MKFINARFFYEADKLIDKSKYSYWWILMGELSSRGGTINADTSVSSTWDALKKATISYEIKNSTQVKLNNAYICGMSKAALPPAIGPAAEDSKGTVVLTASGGNGTSNIPFTVGQNKSDVGHIADSLWLLALNKDITEENVLSLFPFEADPTTTNLELAQKYTGVTAGEKFMLIFDEHTQTSSNYIPLIGYDVVAGSDPVNSINYSGFTVGESIVTLSGLISTNPNN